jgi:hypothetical protein
MTDREIQRFNPRARRLGPPTIAVRLDAEMAVRVHSEHEAGIPDRIAKHESDAAASESIGCHQVAAADRRCADNLRASLPTVRQHRERAEQRLRMIDGAERSLRRAAAKPTTRPCALRRARLPRQRQSHRTVAKPTVGGDSGDEPAEPDGRRRHRSSSAVSP